MENYIDSMIPFYEKVYFIYLYVHFLKDEKDAYQTVHEILQLLLDGRNKGVYFLLNIFPYFPKNI